MLAHRVKKQRRDRNTSEAPQYTSLFLDEYDDFGNSGQFDDSGESGGSGVSGYSSEFGESGGKEVW